MSKTETNYMNRLIDYHKELHYAGEVDESLDCGDFTDSLKLICPLGKKISITTNNPLGMCVEEYGEIKEGYTYHSIYVYNNLVFDPRYSYKPVNYDKYIKNIKELNKGTITIEEE